MVLIRTARIRGSHQSYLLLATTVIMGDRPTHTLDPRWRRQDRDLIALLELAVPVRREHLVAATQSHDESR